MKDINKNLCRSCRDVIECKFNDKFIPPKTRYFKLIYCTNRTERSN